MSQGFDAYLHGAIRNVDGPRDPDEWRKLAASLRDQGLEQAAAAAYEQAAAALPLAADRAEMLAAWAELDRHFGHFEQAEARLRAVRRLRGGTGAETLTELESAEGYVLTWRNDPAGFDAHLDSVADNPLVNDPLRSRAMPSLSVRDMTAYFGAVEDYSFVVMDDLGPVLLVVADVTGDGMLVRGEVAVALTPLRPQVPAWAEILAGRQLALLARWSGAFRVLVEHAGQAGLGGWLAEMSHVRHGIAYCEIALDQSMETIRRAYRETHRQQVAWGRKHLRVESVADRAGFYPPLCELYRTGSHLVPQFTAESLAQPGIHMVAAWMGEELASVVVTADAGTTTYYAAGARMGGSSKPLTHVLIDEAVTLAQARGQTLFSMGALHLHDVSAKLQGIAGFKRGFAASLRPCDWVTVRV